MIGPFLISCKIAATNATLKQVFCLASTKTNATLEDQSKWYKTNVTLEANSKWSSALIMH